MPRSPHRPLRRSVAAIAALACALAGAAPLPAQPAASDGSESDAGDTLAAPASSADNAFIQALLQALNAERGQHGLPALAPDPWLQTIAAAHSQALAQQGRLSHAGFGQRLARSGARFCVENLASGYTRPGALLAGWRQSPEHQRNLVEPQVQRIGLARHGGVVAMLACSADAPFRR